MAKLLSVNVGLPRDVEWQDKTFRTAIWKDVSACTMPGLHEFAKFLDQPSLVPELHG